MASTALPKVAFRLRCASEILYDTDGWLIDSQTAESLPKLWSKVSIQEWAN